MAKQRYINTKFWDDNYIIERDPIEKLLFLWCLTNPLTNISGIYEATVKRISFDTGIEGGMVLNILDRFEKDKKIIYKDGWIGIKNFIKHQSMNPKIKRGIEIELQKAPPYLLKWAEIELKIGYDRLSYSNPNPNNNTNPNLNTWWVKCLQIARDGGKGIEQLEPNIKSALQGAGGISQLRMSNSYVASQMKRKFLNILNGQLKKKV